MEASRIYAWRQSQQEHCLSQYGSWKHVRIVRPTQWRNQITSTNTNTFGMMRIRMEGWMRTGGQGLDKLHMRCRQVVDKLQARSKHIWLWSPTRNTKCAEQQSWLRAWCQDGACGLGCEPGTYRDVYNSFGSEPRIKIYAQTYVSECDTKHRKAATQAKPVTKCRLMQRRVRA